MVGKDGRSRWVEQSQLYLPKGGKKQKSGELFLLLSTLSASAFCYCLIQGEKNPQSWYRYVIEALGSGFIPRDEWRGQEPETHEKETEQETPKRAEIRLIKSIKKLILPQSQAGAHKASMGHLF